jgi:hypothetical protein
MKNRSILKTYKGLFLILLTLISLNFFGQTITHPSSGTSSTTITCGTTYTYYDPGGTGNYGNAQSSVLTINPSVGGQFVQINFGTGGFAIEACGGTSCTCDFIRIYDGTTTGAPLIGRYCTGNVPGVITSTTGSLTIQWSSDAFVTAAGWEADVTCSSSSTTPTAITHPTSGTSSTTVNCGTTYVYYEPGGLGNYSNNQLATLTFNPSAAGQMVQMDFTDGWKSIEDCGGAGCDCDWIKIYDGTSAAAPLIGTYCDGNAAGLIQSTTGSLTVVFDSDPGTVRAGYYAYVTCYTPCSTVPGTAAASLNAICPVGGNTTLSLTGEDPSATIQWQVSTDGGLTWSNIAGATTDPWIQAVSVNSMYRAQVTNGCTSSSNAVTVTAGCSILQPTSGFNTTTISCGNTYNYYDSGNSGSNYSNNENGLITICPSTPGQYVSVTVVSFNINNNDDYLYVFDGDNPASNLIGVYTGTIGAGATITASSANTSGCLSFRFQSDGATTTAGWNLTTTCTATPAAPYPAHSIEDCNGAVTICSNSTLTGGTTGAGMQELIYDDWADCLWAPGENQSQWYVFSSTGNGTIGFEIVPTSPTDYDWAVWGPYNSLACPTFTGDHSIRCNASSLGNSGPNGATGLVAPANDTIEENGVFPGEVTDGDCRVLTVQAGEIYIMMLDNWSGSSVGFNLNWTLGGAASLDCTPPLPISLSSMDVQCHQSNSVIRWVTESEINNNFFIIEKADDNFVFEEIGKVMGAGNSNTPISYEFTDTEVNQKTTYYRLVQVDKDGSVEYHRTVASNCHNNGFEVVKSDLNGSQLDLLISTSTNENIQIKLYSISGQLVGSLNTEINNGNNSISINDLRLNQGIYMLSITGETNNYSTKLLRK